MSRNPWNPCEEVALGRVDTCVLTGPVDRALALALALHRYGTDVSSTQAVLHAVTFVGGSKAWEQVDLEHLAWRVGLAVARQPHAFQVTVGTHACAARDGHRCVFHQPSDPGMYDDCLYCHQPEERK